MSRIPFVVSLFACLTPVAAAASDVDGRYYRERAVAPAYYDPPAYRWQGLYLGVHAGGDFARGFNFSADGVGFVGGGQAGYNMQFGPAVVGVEIEGSHLGDAQRQVGGVSVDQNWRVAGKGRLGLSFDRSLIYATVGYALTEFEAPRFSGVNDGWRGGYLLGGGIEQAFAGGLSVKAEYNYVSSSGLEAKLPFGRTVESDGDHVLKVGLNYRF